MTQSRGLRCTRAAAAAAIVSLGFAVDAQQPDARKPSVSLRATPPMGFSPLRVRTTVDIRDGSDDFADFYCPTIEWDWGDGTISENSGDCNPYEAGKSSIQRRFTAEHTYRMGGSYRVVFRMKQKSKLVGSATASVQVRSGAGEGFGR
ncbi:MAG: hypothetical protein A3F70_13635 [Acidobacteria bacterium RIFCSPLOWO2_12_FULL_67_14]|nr:MAG: hypothetical protein A3H29_04530 [Acidobacteria bacterium RIFCSPLOWO2_02_FULL_67_21]OFW39584.1 MAG: hypothetical protein A3F70_13635 [Acidobacteria bacterium RIFCSPLOWO2_12_FULL_67_14]